MMMRCRLLMMGATAVFGLAVLADAARAGSGHVPAPQAYSGPIATSQGPSPQGEWVGGGCDTCGPVVYESCGGGKHKLFAGAGGCLNGLKCKLGGLGNGLKCGLHDMRGRIGGFKLCHKRPACAPAPCAPCGDYIPSAQSYPSHQGHYAGGSPQVPGK
jgi:hypothetical protein